MSLQSQTILTVQETGALAVSDAVNAVVGSSATLLTAPSGARHLVLMADKGDWRMRIGDFHTSGMPVAADPAASVSDGTGGVKIPAGQSLVIPAPALCTVKGYNATDAITYYYI